MKFSTTDYPAAVSVGRYRIDPERKLRIEEYQGKVGLADLRAVISAMASDPCWSPEHHGLVDFSKAELELSANDVLRLALMMRQEWCRSSGWMVYAVGSPLAYGVVRMLGYWSRNTQRCRIFHSRTEAEAWLERNRALAPPQFREPLDEAGDRAASALRHAV